MGYVKKQYKPVFYRGRNSEYGEPCDTIDQAENEIDNIARRATYDREEPFDFAEVKTIYIPVEIQE
ncbi:hypothetical protein MZM54_04940 [[Brevibacterium] frigoritolerans]|nr:hypothetical protein [Peribacillus frigoritolerans]